MAVPATLSHFFSFSLTTLRRSSLPRLSNSTPPHHRRHRRRHTIRLANPRITTRHGKLNATTGGEAYDEVDEVFFDGDDVMEEESDDEDDAESSVDLLFRFLQSLFKKLSKRAKKASRSVLPGAISPQLVSFAVDGVLLLASLSIIKALLEVVCSIGGAVFVVILLLRVIWASISYFQSGGNDFYNGGTSYGPTQPVT